jgi:TatA/E family protein of Tat protein translocase
MLTVLLFFDISGGELLLILVVAFLVFGPGKIPEIARKVGKGMNEIRRASDEIKREIKKEADKIQNDAGDKNNPLKDLKKISEDMAKPLKDLSSDISRTTSGDYKGTDLKG